MAIPIEDITGRRFGRLVAVRWLYNEPRKGQIWECLCDHGKPDCPVPATVIVRRSNLIAEQTKSCGCLRAEEAAIRMAQGRKISAEKRTGESAYDRTVPAIQFNQIADAWIWYAGEAYHLMTCSNFVFKAAIRETLCGRKLSAEAAIIFNQETLDRMDRWYFLLYLSEVGKAMSTYSSKKAAESAHQKMQKVG